MKHSRGITRVILAIVIGLMGVLFASQAFTQGTANAAATFTVNSTADPGDGVCDATECTLREAINAANASVGSDTIAFNIPTTAPGYMTSAPTWWRIQPLSALPTITTRWSLMATRNPAPAPTPTAPALA